MHKYVKTFIKCHDKQKNDPLGLHFAVNFRYPCLQNTLHSLKLSAQIKFLCAKYTFCVCKKQFPVTIATNINIT